MKKVREGMCMRCRIRPRKTGRSSCESCSEKIKARYWRNVRDGICVRCLKAPAGENYRECLTCRVRSSRTQSARYYAAKEEGKCVICRLKKPYGARVSCLQCWRKYRQRYYSPTKQEGENHVG